MEASCLVCGLCQGYLWRRQADTERLQDWGETKRCVQTRVMLECEREYQEHLLLSVMPAYIAAEVSLVSLVGHWMFCIFLVLHKSGLFSNYKVKLKFMRRLERE